MKNVSFPRWAAPLVGAGLGVFLGLRALHREGQPFDVKPPAIGAAIGLFAGGIIFLLDRPASRPETQEGPAGDPVADVPKRKSSDSTLVGRFLALLSILISWAPFVNLAVALIALLVNARVAGWPRIVSFLGLVLSIAASGVFFAVWVNGM
jgi:hypothetical protein